MANKRSLQTLNQLYKSILCRNPSSSSSSLQYLKTLSSHFSHNDLIPGSNFSLNPKFHQIFSTPNLNASTSQFTISRHFSSNRRDDSDDNDEGEEDDDDDDGDSDSEEEMDDDDAVDSSVERDYSLEEKESEAAAIGYKVIGQLQRGDRVFKKYEPFFAVVQIGSHQFKVSNGDCIFTERLKFCEVNDKVVLNKVLMLGSKTQTMIGRPTLPDAAVHAVVEEHTRSKLTDKQMHLRTQMGGCNFGMKFRTMLAEHNVTRRVPTTIVELHDGALVLAMNPVNIMMIALDAKVIIFKKKRRKNYRRTRGHRQELTKLRITDIQGIEKPEMPTPAKTEKAVAKKVEKAAVAA